MEYALKDILRKYTEDDVGVISPYRLQVEKLRDVAPAAVEVLSVDACQGQEKEIIIFSTVRANSGGSVGFLRDTRRINVALTRARRGLVVIGSRSTLQQEHTTWRKWLKWVDQHGVAQDWTNWVKKHQKMWSQE